MQLDSNVELKLLIFTKTILVFFTLHQTEVSIENAIHQISIKYVYVPDQILWIKYKANAKETTTIGYQLYLI